MRILVTTLLLVLLVGCSDGTTGRGNGSDGETSSSHPSSSHSESPADARSTAGRPKGELPEAGHSARSESKLASDSSEAPANQERPGQADTGSKNDPLNPAAVASEPEGIAEAQNAPDRVDGAGRTIDLSPDGLTQRPSDTEGASGNSPEDVAGSGDRVGVDPNAQLAEEETPEVQTIDIPDSWWRLSKEQEIWIDNKAKQVIVAGQICLREGALELFACPRRTKEHESVISVNALASQVHACFLALGADPGSPVQWQPEYKPATGPVIKIEVLWKENGEIVRRNARDMVRNFETKEPLQMDWVFGGSQVYEDPREGVRIYYGDSGELVCVSNFSTATMDLPIRSTESNDNLLFEANTPNIPEVGTKVYMVFTPVLDKSDGSVSQPVQADSDRDAAADENGDAADDDNGGSADENGDAAADEGGG